MKILTLEACVDGIESIFEAEKGGATRFELCQNLIIGGTSPSYGLFLRARSATDLPIRVLVRPRFGDFLYTRHELDTMLDDIQFYKANGADAIVTGALQADGSLDLEVMKRLREAAGNLLFTLHRAFDVCLNPEETLETAIDLGIDTVLTSGQAPTASGGRKLLARLQKLARGRIEILAGSGIDVRSIELLFREAGIEAFHMSGKVGVDSAMQYRSPDVSMGAAGVDEFTTFRASESAFREARNRLEKLLLEKAE